MTLIFFARGKHDVSWAVTLAMRAIVAAGMTTFIADNMVLSTVDGGDLFIMTEPASHKIDVDPLP